MRILLAVDGSEDAMHAADAVSKMRTHEPADVHVVTVVNPPEVAVDSSAEIWLPQLLEEQQKGAERTLESARSRLAEGSCRVTTQICGGHIAHAILDAAEKFDADLIATGAVGHSPVSRILLGSVSDDVATHAKQSVMVFRTGELFKLDRPLRVTLAYDGSESADKVIDDLSEFAWAKDANIDVVCVSTRIEMFGQEFTPAAIEDSARRRVDAQRLAENGVSRLQPTNTGATATMLESDHTGEGILKAAEQHGSDMIIVGDKGHGLVTRLLLGSTSRYVLRHANQTVLIAR
ncbi:MAG: universal stress protein [Planctomycetota bacterium]